MTGHIPTMDEIIDQLTVLAETTIDQDEHDAAIAMLRIAEDERARQERLYDLAELAEISIAIREPRDLHTEESA